MARDWLTPAEVAKVMRVSSKTVSRWADLGRIPSVRTLGGHHRFNSSVVADLLSSERVEVTGER